MTEKEEAFRKAVQTLIARVSYPDYAAIRRVMGRSWSNRSGLKGPETQWRIQEIEKAGYDWNASKRSQRLVRKQQPQTD